MKLKSYFNPTRDALLRQVVQIRLAADAAPAAPFVLLGDLTHEPVDDNLSGAQKHDVSHAIFQHVQEQVYLKHQIQDMQRINITIGGGFKLVERVFVDQGFNRRFVGEEQEVKVTVLPTDATTNGVKFTFSNPDLVEIVANTGNGVIKFKSLQKGELFLRVRVNQFEQEIPFEFSEEESPRTPPVVAVASVTVAPTTASLAVAATRQLTPTVLPANATNKDVTYTSSDATKATVSASGLVTAVAVGSATITVKTTDGNKTATCEVTVTA